MMTHEIQYGVMADSTAKYEDNVAGSFFVDIECIACDTCVAMAKGHFKLTDDYSHAIVWNQPSTEAEIACCNDALEACPVDAIGCDDL